MMYCPLSTLISRIIVHMTIILILISNITAVKYSHKPHSVLCSQLTVFGDSLSDDGIEVDEHSHGFIRNSNGPVWPEYLNKMLACDKVIAYLLSTFFFEIILRKINGKKLH
uniref:SGNH hydrolase-type esterase domain-containing protein n=1 Tax=Ascaris lumbricoides TaxID=6252 RepID=A0A9J2PGR9_ASCLU